MSKSALFQILYQNETLFHLPEDVVNTSPELRAAPIKTAPEQEVVAEKATLPAAPAPETQLLPSPEIPKPAPAPAPQAAPGFPGLKHKILILIDEQQHEKMIASEEQFLNNILKAVGHSTEHADVLNFSYLPGQDARKVLSEKRTNFFITFGVPLVKLHLDLLLPPYMPKNMDGIWFLLADPLVVIESDRDLKKKLWQALKQMFEMS